MSGITTGIGLFSGIDTTTLINQLLALEGRPKVLAQRRILQLQQQQAAYLDLNSRISALKSAAAAFRLSSVFRASAATSSNPAVLQASASTAAIPGSYTFVVDRLVSTQQMLSRGFASGTAGLSAGTFTFEPAAARLDRDTPLSELNGGDGIARGKIVITDSQGRSATVDLTRVGTVGEVLDAINAAPGLGVTARVQGARFIITSSHGAELTITNAPGYQTATSLGIETPTASAPTVTGAPVYVLGANLPLATLNDGNGVFVSSQVGQARYDFTIRIDDGTTTTSVRVNIGPVYNAQGEITEAAPTTVGGVLARINAALENALGDASVTASIGADGVSLRLVDSQGRQLEVLENGTGTTARDLGLLTSSPQTGTVQGVRILASMNSTLVRNLRGGAGLTGDGQIQITARDGSTYTVLVDLAGSLDAILAAFEQATAGKVRASLNAAGTGLLITDTTGGTQNLIIEGDTAESLGIATGAGGVAASRVRGGNLQRQYVTRQTLLASLRNGAGVGTGTFRITDSMGVSQVVTVSASDRTLDDIIRNINSRPDFRVRARINDSGDGLLLYEEMPGGAARIRVEDVTGSVATNLNIAGQAGGTGAENVIDGSFERQVTFEAGHSLQDIAAQINTAGVGVSAAVINDGTGAASYRLSLSARTTGTAGRFVIDAGDFDLGLTELDPGRDARVFFGSADPARAVLLTGSRNTLDGVITGVSIDLRAPSADPVTLTVARDTAAIENAINAFVSAFNALVQRIADHTRYDQASNTRGALLGEGTVQIIRSAMFATIQGEPIGVGGTFRRLAEIGITVGRGGTLSLDRERFRRALEQDFQGVADLLAAYEPAPAEPTQVSPGVTVNEPSPPRFNRLGIAGRIEVLADSYINAVTGLLTRRNETLNDQIQLQQRRIAGMDARLAIRRQVLERQFLAMEQAIARLRSQQTALGGLTSLL